MTRRRIHGITYGFQQGERGWGNDVNNSLEYLAVTNQLSVDGVGTTAPPAAPALGETHIVGDAGSGTGTGAWSTTAVNQLTTWVSDRWTSHSPLRGTRAWYETEEILYAYTGAAWIPIAARPWKGTQAQYDALTDVQKALPRLHLITGS